MVVHDEEERRIWEGSNNEILIHTYIRIQVLVHIGKSGTLGYCTHTPTDLTSNPKTFNS